MRKNNLNGRLNIYDNDYICAYYGFFNEKIFCFLLLFSSVIIANPVSATSNDRLFTGTFENSDPSNCKTQDCYNILSIGWMMP